MKLWKRQSEEKDEEQKIRIDFSLKREVFFVVVGAAGGAIIFGFMANIIPNANWLALFHYLDSIWTYSGCLFFIFIIYYCRDYNPYNNFDIDRDCNGNISIQNKNIEYQQDFKWFDIWSFYWFYSFYCIFYTHSTIYTITADGKVQWRV